MAERLEKRVQVSIIHLLLHYSFDVETVFIISYPFASFIHNASTPIPQLRSMDLSYCCALNVRQHYFPFCLSFHPVLSKTCQLFTIFHNSLPYIGDIQKDPPLRNEHYISRDAISDKMSKRSRDRDPWIVPR